MLNNKPNELTQQQLFFSALNCAYSDQAYCVDNGGSDDESYRRERKCDTLEAEVKRRGLKKKFDRWCCEYQ